MPLNNDKEYELITKACDQSNQSREDDKNKLWEYIYGTYYEFLKSITLSFNVKLPRNAKLPDPPEDICNEFIAEIIEYDKLCKWGSTPLKASLTVMLKNYLIDTMRKYSTITFEKDARGNKVRDLDGSNVVKDIKTKKPLLSSCESIFIPTGEISDELEENPVLHKGKSPYTEEETIVDKLTCSYEKMNYIQDKAISTLQRIRPRDANIIYMEMQNISRPEIAKKLGVEVSGINQIINRAYNQYAIIFYRLLREEGIETEISTDKLKRLLIDVTRK
jgi:DNA-directed RNA polymerase specialized sigma24 family protein